jgi:lipoyl(octanoyl) transferase
MSKIVEPIQWRLIIDRPASGSWNMAVDDALLEAAQGEGYIPTLRLYSWNPPCLSLGHAQHIREVDQEALIKMGWDLVRRPTGGRAILHIDELTYSITGNAEQPILKGGILESYQKISQAFIQMLRKYSLDPRSREEAQQTKNQVEPVCFEIPSNYEITVAGKKIIGSAQARRKNAILQHGAIPLTGDISRIIKVLTYTDEDSRTEAAQRVLLRATTIADQTGKSVSWHQSAMDLVRAFKETHNLDFKDGELTAEERISAKKIEQEKYGNKLWNERI